MILNVISVAREKSWSMGVNYYLICKKQKEAQDRSIPEVLLSPQIWYQTTRHFLSPSHQVTTNSFSQNWVKVQLFEFLK